MVAIPAGTLPSVLPPLYAAWMDDLLKGPIPRETVATCENCAMHPGAGDRSQNGLFFAPDVKCCTYIPVLPNFLVGRILDDMDPASAAGRATVESRLTARVGVTPLGLTRPSVQALLYEHGAQRAFGRSRNLRCPHYLEEGGGRCGIWRHRNGVCATWFCKYARGATGEHFWQKVNQLFLAVEHHLARWCVLQLDVGTEALLRLFPLETGWGDRGTLDHHQIDGTVDEAVYRKLWGPWWGREQEFFHSSAQLVSELPWTRVTAISGPDVQLCAQLTLAAYHELVSEQIPDRLVLGPFETVGGDRDHVRVVTYSGFDPLDLPRLLVAVLPYFDGGSTTATLRRIHKERGITLEAALVRRLVDHRILIPGD